MKRYIAAMLIMSICMVGCGSASLQNDMVKEKEEDTLEVLSEPSLAPRKNVDTLYSCDVNGKHISFSAPAGFKPHEPLDAMYVHSQEYYMEGIDGIGSCYMNVVVSESAYEEALSVPTERTAEEYLSRLSARGEDFVGLNQTNTIAEDVSFGDYSGYYYAYEYSDYAPKNIR